MEVVSNCQSMKDALHMLEGSLRTIQREQLRIENNYIPLFKIEQLFHLETMTMEKKEYFTRQLETMYHLLQSIDAYLNLKHRKITFPVTYNIERGIITSRLFNHEVTTNNQKQPTDPIDILYQLYLEEYTHFYMKDITSLILQHCEQELGQQCHFLRQGENGYILPNQAGFKQTLATIYHPHQTDFKPKDLLLASNFVYDLIDSLIQHRLLHNPLYFIPENDKIIQMVRCNGYAS